MNRRRFCMALGSVGALLCPPGTGSSAEDRLAEGNSAGHNSAEGNSPEATHLRELSAQALGTTVRLLARHPSAQVATAAMSEALAEVELIESLMSVYRPTSQLSLLNRHGQLKNPHPLLVQVLRRAMDFSLQTNSAFDVTVQRLWSLYATCAKRNELPNDQQLRAARATIGRSNVEIGDDQIRLRNGAQVTLNGIAQGFATDRIRQILLGRGIQHALIDVGELAGIGVAANEQPWKVGIQHPREEDAFVAITRITGRCLATSGDYETTFTDDFRAHHIFDPHTGYSPTELASVSVLAPSATEADALSTALLVMGADRSAMLLARKRDVDAMFVRKDGRVSATQGFPKG